MASTRRRRPPACDSRLSRIYISRRANAGKQNKQRNFLKKKMSVKNPSKRLQPEDNPGEGWGGVGGGGGGGGEPSVVKSDS